MRDKKKHASKAQGVPPPKGQTGYSAYNALNAPIHQWEDDAATRPFFVVSAEWLSKWRKGQPPPAVINAELMHPNPWQWPVKLITPSLVAAPKNGLELHKDFELASDRAWNYLTERYAAIALTRNFCFSADWYAERTLALNLIVVSGEEVRGWLVCGEAAHFFEELAEAFALPDSHTWRVFLLPTQHAGNSLLRMAEQGQLSGREVADAQKNNFAGCKAGDALLLCPQGVEVQACAPPPARGLCHNCGREAELRFACPCMLVSYCSFNCKCEDFALHRHVCGTSFAEFRSEAAVLAPPPQRDPEAVGLVNIGNFCYGNALAHALAAIEGARVQSPLESFSAKTAGFWHAMQQLEGAVRAPQPWGLKLCLGAQACHFMGSEQQDAHEALITLLSALEEGDEASQQLARSFKGEVTTKLCCTACGAVGEGRDPFFVLSVPLARAGRGSLTFGVVTEGKPFDIQRVEASVGDKESMMGLTQSIPPSDKTHVLFSVADGQSTRVISIDDLPLLLKELTADRERTLLAHCFAERPAALLSLIPAAVPPSAGHLALRMRLGPARLLALYSSPDSPLPRLEVFAEILRQTAKILLPESLQESWEMLLREEDLLEALVIKLFSKESGADNNSAEGKALVEAVFSALKPRPFQLFWRNARELCANCNKSGTHLCALSPQGSVDWGNWQGWPLVEVLVEFHGKSAAVMEKKLAEERRISYAQPPESQRNFTLAAGLNAYLAAQEIECKCEKCSHPSALLTTQLSKLPQILVVHFKRFTTSYIKNTTVTRKMNEVVDWEMSFAIDQVQYSLFAVVDHTGDLDSGHYTVHVHNGSEWLFFDDEKVVREPHVKSVKSGKNYLLFYRMK